jgi:hypothetical protein
MASSPDSNRMSPQGPEQCGCYRITVHGRIGTHWSTWFDGLTVTPDNGITILEGKVDQATLRGILSRIWDLNLTLISVTRRTARDNAGGAVVNE